MSIAMARKGFFLVLPLIITSVMSLAVDFRRMLNANPATPGLSIPQVKELIFKGSKVQMQDYSRMVKGDLEVYAGFYLIATVFAGESLFAPMFYF